MLATPRRRSGSGTCLSLTIFRRSSRRTRATSSAHGLNTELQRVPLISNIVPALLNGDLQVGIGTPTEFLQAVNAGLDLVIVAGSARITQETNPVSLVVAKDSGIHNAEQLKGKRLAVPSLGSSLELLLRRWLEKNGVNPKDIQIVELGFPIQSDALKSKQIDAAIVAEPFRSRMYEAGIAEKLVRFPSRSCKQSARKFLAIDTDMG